MRSIKYHYRKLDRFYRKFIIGLEIMSLAFVFLYMAVDHSIWICWFMGSLTCVFNTLSILYAEENFRWSMSWRVRHPEQVKPSQNELDRREGAAVLGALFSLGFFLLGLLANIS